ncbi:MAG: Mannosyl transferase [Candidatus Woesebacteria bacterium GW2011_GWD2_40_19]|nr:MAG: Mannosyl transferase [Candidatus Woesebacteria bacterium GW2011_GWD2_40_19]
MLERKRSAKENIKFVGEVSETKLAKYYQNAKALIMPQEEDFGIVAVEAQSYGVPVIAYKKGGSLDTVIDGKTGILFDKQNPKTLIRAVRKFEKMKFDKKRLTENARKFSKARFKKEFLDLTKKMLN